MRTNIYPLQALFEVRERAKSDAENRFRKAQKELLEAEQQLLEWQDELSIKITHRRQCQLSYFTAVSLNSVTELQTKNTHLNFLQALEKRVAEKIAQQRLVVNECKQAAEKTLTEVVETARQCKTIDKHKNKWLQVQRQINIRKEEEQVDDIHK